MVSCGALLTRDDTPVLLCVIGYTTSLNLVMLKTKSYRPIISSFERSRDGYGQFKNLEVCSVDSSFGPPCKEKIEVSLELIGLPHFLY